MSSQANEDSLFAVVGVETTGLTKGDAVVEVGVALLDVDMNPVGLWHTLINPERPMNARASAVHGHTTADLVDAPTFEQVAPGLLRVLAGRKILSFGGSFVKRMLLQDFCKLSERPLLEIGCVMTAAKNCDLPTKRSDLAAALGVPHSSGMNCGVVGVSQIAQYLSSERNISFEVSPFSDRLKLEAVNTDKTVEIDMTSIDGEIQSIRGALPDAEPDVPTHSLKPTEEQLDALRLIKSGVDLTVVALAGTGKTTLLRMAVSVLPPGGLYLAFNKAIQEEAEAKFPKSVWCRTIHSLAWAAVGSKYEDRMSGRKMWPSDVVKHLGVEGFRGDTFEMSKMEVNTLVSETLKVFCQSAEPALKMGMVPISRELKLEGNGGVGMALKQHVLGYAETYWKDVVKVNGVLPFSQDFYLKMYQLSRPNLKREWVMLDEAQDANPAMVDILTSQVDTQIILVGDPGQQIYEWNGSQDALENAGITDSATLTKSWRFGPEIAAEANAVLARIGSSRIEGAGASGTVGRIKSPDAILCRTNSGLIAYAIEAMRAGRKVAIVGGTDEVVGFAKSAGRMKSGKRARHQELSRFKNWSVATAWAKDEGKTNPDLARLIRLVNKVGAENLQRLLSSCVDERRADVVLSTTHKAKGREWGSVKLGRDYKPTSKSKEEQRLLYVAMTRAMTGLDLGDLPD